MTDSPSKQPLWKVAQLDGIQLIRVEASTDWDQGCLPMNPPPLVMNIDSKWEESKKDKKITVKVNFTVVSLGENECLVDDAPFLISAVYRVTYKYPDKHKILKADAEDFATRNAPFNVYPYWRELVHSISGKMGLPFAPLPLFRITSSASQAKQNKKQ